MTAATATSHHRRRFGGAAGGAVGGGVGGIVVRVVVIGAVAEIGGGGGGGTTGAGGTTTAGGGGTGGASTAVAVGPAPMRAAPSATASFGFDVNTTGRCSSSRTSVAASGMRDEPPTISTALTWSSCRPASNTAVRNVCAALRNGGRTICSNWARVILTRVLIEPTFTGTVASRSSLSASLASWQSSRRRTRAGVSASVSAAASSPDSDMT